MIKPFSFLIALAGLVVGSEADAQLFGRARSARMRPANPVTASPRSFGPTMSTPVPRTSATTGSNDFPYHGTPYDRPYGPWTWPTMSGSYSRGLAHYYAPPVK
jgi:hypothetical protein